MKAFYNLLIFLILAVMLTACNGESAPLRQISDTLGADISSAAVLENLDTHGGFHGDGKTFLKLQFSTSQSNTFCAEIQDSDYWHSLPLSENTARALYGSYGDGYSHAPLFQNDNGDPLLPEVENGYYFFCDRHSEAADPADDSALHSRYSWNFTIAVYDADTMTLYYFELDT